MRDRRIAVAIVLAGLLLLPACAEAKKADKDSGDGPARLEAVEGSDVEAVVLTAEAAQRIELETAAVERTSADGGTSIPHAAVFYGLTGETWTYASPTDLTYVRTPITVDHIDGDVAYLTSGPATGTQVVTVGSAELFGVESGIGD